MSRPRVNEEDKRVVQVNIRLTAEENTQLSEYANSSGLSPANWIRKKIFSGKNPPARLSPLDASLYNELKRIGVNLNQVTHKINAGEFPKEYLVRQLELQMMLNKVIKILLHDSQHD